jgi:hypothetical protein
MESNPTFNGNMRKKEKTEMPFEHFFKTQIWKM